MMAQRATKMKMKTFETLSGAAFMKMEPHEIAALSRDELVRLAFRVRAIMAAIATYMRGLETTTTTLMTTTVTAAIVTTTSMVTTVRANFDIQCVADYESMTTHEIDALSKEELVQLAVNGQDILQRCPFKPGCRFCSLPDEYYLHVLLEWLTIEDQARFDMALLNHMDRRAHLHVLRDTEHKGVLSVSGKKSADGSKYGYQFISGVCAWLESRNVFMRALKFQDQYRDIPAGFLARTGRQLLKLDLSYCRSISDAELGELFARCPNLEEVNLLQCSEITDAALECLARHRQSIHTVDLWGTQVTDAGLAILAEGCRNIKKLGLFESCSDAGLGKIAEMCPSLEDVNLYGCNAVTDAGLSRLVSHCRHIHTLDLGGTQATGEGLALSRGSCGNMKKLRLDESDITDAGLGKIAEMCPKLEDVDLGNCSAITDVGLSSLLTNCLHIHTLLLSNTQVTGEGLDRQGGVCERLKMLHLTDSRTISDAGLGKIAEMCPNLEEVALGRCSSITDVGLSSLMLCQHIRTLDLYGTQITGDGLARQGGGCVRLMKLNLGGLAISDAGLGKIAEMCPNLEWVNLHRCLSITDVGLSSLVMLCQHIHTVNFSNTSITGARFANLGVGWKNMKKLHLCALHISDAGLGKIAKMCPNLEEVNLECCDDITDVGLGNIAETWPNLEDVKIERCDDITDAGLSNLVSRCKHTHTLDLSCTTEVDGGEGLARQGGSCVRLKKISLWALAITDDGLGKIAEMCPNLEEVYLRECWDITDAGAGNLAQRCPKLRTLDLSDTEAKAKGVASLRKAYPALHVIFCADSDDEDDSSENHDQVSDLLV